MPAKKSDLQLIQDAIASKNAQILEFLYPVSGDNPTELYVGRKVAPFRLAVSREGNVCLRGWDKNTLNGKSRAKTGFRTFRIDQMLNLKVVPVLTADGEPVEWQAVWQSILTREGLIQPQKDETQQAFNERRAKIVILFPNGGSQDWRMLWKAGPSVASEGKLANGLWDTVPCSKVMEPAPLS